jgi:hypothetical protein
MLVLTAFLAIGVFSVAFLLCFLSALHSESRVEKAREERTKQIAGSRGLFDHLKSVQDHVVERVTPREKLGNPERCSTEEPLLRDFGGGHQTACHFAEQISADSVAEAVETQSVLETAVADSE